MTKRGDNEGNIAPFLAKCYEMVNDETTDAIISWSQSNDSFIVWNMAEFTGNLLPKFFKHRNFSSFMRQLNIYEFDSAYGPAWHCIVGTSFGSYVTHSLGGFLYFSIDKVYILLFRTVVEPLKQ